MRAIREKWPEDAGKPATLDELVNPADEIGRQAHVIVLDQFEQLRGSKPIFRLLRKIARESKPPHRITWVIAFRHEFSGSWMDFVCPEQERGFRPPQDLSLRLFTSEQAREVIGQLVNESNLLIEQAAVDNLVEACGYRKCDPRSFMPQLIHVDELNFDSSFVNSANSASRSVGRRLFTLSGHHSDISQTAYSE